MLDSAGNCHDHPFPDVVHRDILETARTTKRGAPGCRIVLTHFAGLVATMVLAPEEFKQFQRLQCALMFFVNQRLNVIPDQLVTPDKFISLATEARIKVREALVAHVDLIDAFVAENPFHISDDELEIVRSWRHLVYGNFFVFRYLANYAVFLTESVPAVAYGVSALTQPFEEVIGPNLPVLIQTVLIPFKDKIVYDGSMGKYSVSFGPGIRRSLNDGFKEAKAIRGIVTSLPMSDEPPARKPPKAKSAPKSPTKQEKQDTLQVVIGLLDEFCKQHLNDEYAILCRKLAEKLSRKRPSPLLQGRPNAWASGIVRAIGGVNFLHDKSQTPYLKATDIDQHLGTSSSNGAAKLAAIRKMFGMHPFDPKWSLPSRLDDNPRVWMLQVNGFVIDVRNSPRELQEIAFKKGLIPYIPADRSQDPIDGDVVQPAESRSESETGTTHKPSSSPVQSSLWANKRKVQASDRNLTLPFDDEVETRDPNTK